MRSLIPLPLLVAWPLVAQAPAQPSPDLVPVTPGQWRQLRWLEGNWRGSGGSYPSFFESYRWVDDSTVEQKTYADSTLSEVTESSRIMHRGGRIVRERNGVRRGGAVLFTGDSIRYDSGVLWVRRADDHWTAILGGGRVVYELRHYRR